MCAALYYTGKTTEPRDKVDARFANILSEFNKQEDLCFHQYVERKLQAWYSGARYTQSPLTLRVCRGGGGADDQEGEDGGDDVDAGEGEEADAGDPEEGAEVVEFFGVGVECVGACVDEEVSEHVDHEESDEEEA